MRKNIFLKTLTLSILFAFACNLAGCSKKSEETTAQKDSKYGGDVTVGITQEPGTFDPHTVLAAGDKEILFNIFEGLYKFDSKGNLNPCLATDCTISDDAMEYKFTIRDDVYFHNGNLMTTDDVVYSIKRAAGLDSEEGTALVSELDSVTDVVASDNTVTVTLDTPNSELLSYFTTAIIPDEVSDIANDPIGTGPFVFDSYNVGQNVILTRNDNYWQSEFPYLDSVTFKICTDLDSGFLELQNGSIDVFPHMTMDKASQLDAHFNILDNASNMVQIFALNNAVAPFDDERVREAINYAINRDDLISLSMDGAGVPLTTAMSPAMGAAYDTSLDGTYSQDLVTAKELLAEAGYEDGFDMTITVPSDYLVHVNTAIAIADQLSQIGINCEIEQVDWASWLQNVYTDRNYQTTVICLTSNYAPFDVISRYSTESSSNFINFSDERVDAIIEQIPQTADENEKIELFHELLGYMTEDNASCYIQDPQEIVAVSSELAGYEVYPMYVQDMSTVYFV